MRSRRPRTLVAGVALVAAAACSGGGRPQRSAPPAPTSTIAPEGSAAGRSVDAATRRQVVAALADRPRDLGGPARYAVRTRAVVHDRSRPVFSVVGIADLGASLYRGHEDYFADDGTFQRARDYFATATSLYEQAAGGGWTPETPPNPLGSPVPLAPVVGRLHGGGQAAYADDREQRIRIVDAVVADVELVGTETLHDVPTRHYRALVERDGVEALPADVQAEMRRWSEVPPIDHTIDVWLDDGRLRQWAYAPPPGDSGLAVETEYWDVGAVPGPEVPEGLPA
jgi:hypothetical protein